MGDSERGIVKNGKPLTIRQLLGKAKRHEQRGRLLSARKLLGLALEQCESEERERISRRIQKLAAKIITRSALGRSIE